MDEPITRAIFNGEVLDIVRKEVPETAWKMEGNNSVFTCAADAEQRSAVIVFKNQDDDTPVDLILRKNGEDAYAATPSQASIDAVLLKGPAATAKRIVHFFSNAAKN